MKRAASLSLFSFFLLLLGITCVLTGMFQYRKEQPYITFNLDSLNAEYQLSYGGKCIAPFELNNVAVNGIELEVHTKANQELVKNRFYFNDIGQFYRGEIALTSGSKFIRIEFSGVQQIHAQLSGNLFHNPFSIEQNIDGPIVLLENRNHYQLRIPFKKRIDDSSKSLESITIQKRNPNQICNGTMPVLPSLPPFANNLIESLTKDEGAR